jgi:hypothetical protein
MLPVVDYFCNGLYLVSLLNLIAFFSYFLTNFSAYSAVLQPHGQTMRLPSGGYYTSSRKKLSATSDLLRDCLRNLPIRNKISAASCFHGFSHSGLHGIYFAASRKEFNFKQPSMSCNTKLHTIGTHQL